MLNNYKTKISVIAIILISILKSYGIIPADLAQTLIDLCIGGGIYGIYDKNKRTWNEPNVRRRLKKSGTIGG